MLRFCKEIFCLSHSWGRYECSAYTETAQNKGFSTSDDIFKKITFDPFIFADNSFSKIGPINRDRDVFISENV